jgi:hypothetical protein
MICLLEHKWTLAALQLQHQQVLLKMHDVLQDGVIDELYVEFLILNINACLEEYLLLVIEVFQDFDGLT